MTNPYRDNFSGPPNPGTPQPSGYPQPPGYPQQPAPQYPVGAQLNYLPQRGADPANTRRPIPVLAIVVAVGLLAGLGWYLLAGRTSLPAPMPSASQSATTVPTPKPVETKPVVPKPTLIPRPSPDPVPTKVELPINISVRYEATAPGKATVSYLDDDNQPVNETFEKSWTKTFKVTTATLPIVNVLALEKLGSPVSCRVSVNDKQISKKSGKVTVMCSPDLSEILPKE